MLTVTRIRLANTLQAAHRLFAGRWPVISTISGVLAFALTSLLMWYSFDQTLKSTERIAAVSLARDLRKELRETKVCDELTRTVMACGLICKRNGGSLDYPAINDCLNFLDEVGQYVEMGVIDEQLADQLFGGAVIELTVYPELVDYIAKFEQVEPPGLSHLSALSRRLQGLPHRAGFARRIETACPAILKPSGS